MVTLPTEIPSASQWRLVDYLELRRQTAPAGSSGVAQLELQQLDPDEMWLVDHMVVLTSAAATNEAEFRLYAGYADPLNLLDGSSNGVFDVADWPQGLMVRPSTSLVARWSPILTGGICYITLQARVLRRG